MELELSQMSIIARQQYLQSLVAPRPIALVSTIDLEGRPNVSPFSFFNLFSVDPPLVIFGPNRSARTGHDKDTYLNLLEVAEAVINIVDAPIIQQVSDASAVFPRGVSEFEKVGFTPIAMKHVRPPGVKESKARLECRVMEIKTIGAAHLVIAEIVHAYVSDEWIVDGRIDPMQAELVARMGGDWYMKVNKEGLMRIPKPD